MIWTALLAAAWSVRDREHITVEIILPYLPAGARRALEVVRHLLVAAFCLAVLPSAVSTTMDVHAQLGVAIEIAERRVRQPADQPGADGVVVPAPRAEGVAPPGCRVSVIAPAALESSGPAPHVMLYNVPRSRSAGDAGAIDAPDTAGT